VRFLIDESLQQRIGDLLTQAGHEALHVEDLDLRGASDDQVLAALIQERCVLVTADTDFGTLLALSGDPFPSVILLRRPGRRPEQRAAAILGALDVVEARLPDAAMVVVEPHRLRIRDLPIAGRE
jgi:predicted nuclease of predicted toxin-antitoxin system